jgi:hypothetical protein
MVTAAKDQKTRSIQREMAAEWLRLADAILIPALFSKGVQLQKGIRRPGTPSTPKLIQ